MGSSGCRMVTTIENPSNRFFSCGDSPFYGAKPILCGGTLHTSKEEERETDAEDSAVKQGEKLVGLRFMTFTVINEVEPEGCPKAVRLLSNAMPETERICREGNYKFC